MEYHIRSSRSYRYFTVGNPETSKYLLIVMHGYGQLAEYFIRKFAGIPEDYFIVAPEGMHRFYLSGSSGRVGASWMTKEDRENDIADNINWLNDLNRTFSEYNFKRRVLLGFSQGGATAARWFYNSKIPFDHLILWATVFPPDLKLENEISEHEKGRNYFVLGCEDEYYDDKEQKILLDHYTSLRFKCYQFKGKHDIHQATLTLLFSEIEKGK